MYRLTVRDSFDAAHFLPNHKGKCKNMHGHTWFVEVEVSAKELSSYGMVLDFQNIKDALRLILSCFDHTVLNEHKSFKLSSPTAENVATVIFSRMRDQIKQTSAVTVWESPTAWVRLEETMSQ